MGDLGCSLNSVQWTVTWGRAASAKPSAFSSLWKGQQSLPFLSLQDDSENLVHHNMESALEDCILGAN